MLNISTLRKATLVKNKMPHETLIPNVSGFIDTEKVTDDSYVASGWAFESKELLTSPFRLVSNNQIYPVVRSEREDVGKYYNTQSIINCGWAVNVKTLYQCELQMNLNSKWTTILLLNKSGLKNTSAPVPPPVVAPAPAVAPKPVTATVPAVAPAATSQTNVTNSIPTSIVIDNFYENPDFVRNFALKCTFQDHPAYHKGKRTDQCYRFAGLKERFETLLGRKIVNWEKYGTNGCFQSCIAGDQLVYHHDGQQYAGVLYLTPDAPPQAGTNLYRSKYTKKMKVPEAEHGQVFKNGYLDSTEFDLVDVVGNVYNRLILFDAQVIHAASTYFGTTKENGRLFQLFFFDLE